MDPAHVTVHSTMWTRPDARSSDRREVARRLDPGEELEVVGSDTPQWAFVEWHGQQGYLPVSSLLRDNGDARCEVGWPPQIPPPPLRPGIHWPFIHELEGYHPEGEMPGSSSGVTVAHGIDLQSRGPTWLRNLFLASPGPQWLPRALGPHPSRGPAILRSIVNKLSSYGPQPGETGAVVGGEAWRRLHAQALSLTDAECAVLDAYGRHNAEVSARHDYERATHGTFAALPGAAQTALASIAYNFGSIPAFFGAVMGAMASANLLEAARHLRAFTGPEHGRRHKEAAFIEASLGLPWLRPMF